MDDLQNVCLVGHGSSGFVKKAIHKRTGLPLVVKVIHFDAQSELLRKQVTTELRTLYGSRHAHIVKYHQSFFDGGCITIVMEYMDAGSLAHVLQRHVATPLPEDMIAEIARQALEVRAAHAPCCVRGPERPPGTLSTCCDVQLKVGNARAWQIYPNGKRILANFDEDLATPIIGNFTGPSSICGIFCQP